MKTNMQKHWWIIAINGLLAILFGVLALYDSETMMISISKYFGLLVLIGGVLLLIGALDYRKKHKEYILMMAEAFIMIILGILIMVFPAQTIKVFLILIGIWSFLLGLAKLYIGLALGKEFSARYFFILGGILFAAIGLVLLIDPIWVGSHLLRVFGLIFIVLGMVLAYNSFMLKRLKAE